MKVIIISGPTGSGKTTLSNLILKKIKNSISLSTDNYYKTGLISKVLSNFIEAYFERTISFNYKLFKKDFNFIIKNQRCNHNYSYDFINKKIKKSMQKSINIEFLIVEGIFSKILLKDQGWHNCFYLELKTNKESCMNRVINRDVNERGKSKQLARNDFLKSWKYYYRKNNNLNKNSHQFHFSKNTDIDILIKKIINSKA